MIEVNIPSEIKIQHGSFKKDYMITNNEEYLNNFKYYLSFCKYNSLARAEDHRSFGFHLYRSTMNIICGSNTNYKEPAIEEILNLNNINFKEIKEEYSKGLRIY